MESCFSRGRPLAGRFTTRAIVEIASIRPSSRDSPGRGEGHPTGLFCLVRSKSPSASPVSRSSLPVHAQHEGRRAGGRSQSPETWRRHPPPRAVSMLDSKPAVMLSASQSISTEIRRPSESSLQVDGLPIFDESGLPPSSRVGVRLRCTGSISARASIVTSATWHLAMAPRGTPGYVHERPHQADLR